MSAGHERDLELARFEVPCKRENSRRREMPWGPEGVRTHRRIDPVPLVDPLPCLSLPLHRSFSSVFSVSRNRGSTIVIGDYVNQTPRYTPLQFA